MVKVKLVYGTMDRERDGWMERIKSNNLETGTGMYTLN